MDRWSNLGILCTENEAVNQQRLQMYRDYWENLQSKLRAKGLQFQLGFDSFATQMTIYVNMPDGTKRAIQFRSLATKPPLQPIVEFAGVHHWTDDVITCALRALE